jgi:hypothetical protein
MSSSSSSWTLPLLTSPPQVTVLVVDRDYVAEAAVLCSLLGDVYYNTRSLVDDAVFPTRSAATTVVRVVTDDPSLFFVSNSSSGSSSSTTPCTTPTEGSIHSTPQKTRTTKVPCAWRCHEKLPHSYGSNQWATRLGKPNGVYSIEELERALIGNDTHDDGGMVDLILLCGTSLALLQRVATAVSFVSSRSSCNPTKTTTRTTSSSSHSNSNPPLSRTTTYKKKLVIGSIGSFRTLDWLARRVTWGTTTRASHPTTSTITTTTAREEDERIPSLPCHPLQSPQSSSSSSCIAFCAFTSPLWQCRILRQGLVVFHPAQAPSSVVHAPRLIVQPPECTSWCHQLWKPILQSTQQQHQCYYGSPFITMSPPPPPRQLGVPSSLWQGAVLLFYQLQDPSIILFPCLVVASHNTTTSLVLQQQHKDDPEEVTSAALLGTQPSIHVSTGRANTNTNTNTVGKLALQMVVELYRLYHSMSYYLSLPTDAWTAFVIQHDTLLIDLVASPMWVAFTNNTPYEIMTRLDQQQQSKGYLRKQQQHKKSPIQHARFIESLITRHAKVAWNNATCGEPAELAASRSDSRSRNDKKPKKRLSIPTVRRDDIHESVCHGLLWLLEVGQIFGTDERGGSGGGARGVEQRFPTTLYVVRQLQSILRNRPQYILDPPHPDPVKGSCTIVWNDNVMVAAAAGRQPQQQQHPAIVSARALGITTPKQLVTCLATNPTDPCLPNNNNNPPPLVSFLRSSL